ncbi:MAG: type II toxin-antitoxin system HigB family toxin [Bacteroidaceae bacterium]|nr:type II toxin-antitoxin system HigB family toxin [Bacteroidaceae bacterium]MDO5482866.1 type II toxin-antitoxin system HigB family toxin [Bacteroidaceae bacterium]
MKILKYKLLKDFWKKHPEAEDPLKRWAELVENIDWKSHAELKETFPAADYVGNDRYVFNISGNKFRMVTVVVFFNGFLHVRFVGTHAEYDKIKNIKTI